jgi:hypothetical protein
MKEPRIVISLNKDEIYQIIRGLEVMTEKTMYSNPFLLEKLKKAENKIYETYDKKEKQDAKSR